MYMNLNTWSSGPKGSLLVFPGVYNYKLLNAGTPKNGAYTLVEYATPFPGWAKIVPTDKDGKPKDPVQYIWYKSLVNPKKALTGETVYYIRKSNFMYDPKSLPANTFIAFTLDVGADNAFLAILTINPYIGINPQKSISFNIPGGNMDLSYSDIETGPQYNWQKIYHFAKNMFLQSGTTSFDVTLFIQIVNYKQPHGSVATNPAMLQYAFDLHTSTAVMESEIV